ncbi:MAG: ATP-binding protein [Bacteroidales bacterium]
MPRQRNYIPKKIRRRLRIFVILSLFFLGLSFLFGHLYTDHDPTDSVGRKVQAEFRKREDILKGQISYIRNVIDTKSANVNYLEEFKSLNGLYRDKGYGLCIFKKDKLVYWTDSQISYEDILKRLSYSSNRIVKLPTSKNYVIREAIKGEVKVYGLIQIDQEFEVENNYFTNGISPHLGLSESFSLHMDNVENSFPVLDGNGNFVFSITCNNIKEANKIWGQVTIVLLSLLFFVFMAMISILAWINRKFFFLNVPILCLFAVGVYCLYQMPFIEDTIVYKNLLLSYDFSAPHVQSMSTLYVYTVIVSFIVLAFSVDFKRLILWLPKKWMMLMGIMFLIFSASYTILLGDAVRVIVDNASFNMSFDRILDVSFSSILGIFCIAILSINTFRASRVVVTALCRRCNPSDIAILIFTFAVVAVFLKIFIFDNISVYAVVFFFCINGLFTILKVKFVYKYHLTYITISALMMSLFITLELAKAIENREWKLMEMRSVTLDDDRNIEAEMRLQEIGDELRRDTAVVQMFNNQAYTSNSFEHVYEHIKRTYFNLAFSGHDIRMAAEVDNPYSHSHGNNEIGALNYLISVKGERIGNSNFYFLGHEEGLNSYIGRFRYSLWNGMQATLLINIHKRPFYSQLETSNLLYPKTAKESPLTKHFSYGKYYNGVLIYQDGTYAYSRGMLNMPETAGVSKRLKMRGYNHLVNKVSNNSHTVVSVPSTRVADYITSFGYIFVIVLCFSVLVSWLFNGGLLGARSFRDNIRTKIQISVIAVNLVAVTLLSVTTISGSIAKNVELKKEELNRNSQTVFDYLENLISSPNYGGDKMQAIKNELPRLSDVLRTLIVLYDTNGKVIMSTNPEIDRLGIIGQVMNMDAYYNFKVNLLFKYANDDQISNLKYHAVYQAIITEGNKQVGYVCIPYVTITKEETRILSNTFITLMNMFILVFVLSVIASVFISNQITQPLTLLKANLMSIKFGKGNKKLRYNSSDEIGRLVEEYNLSLDKIEESSKLLARTEREIAWREMAKQIAHEIKNPLTPLKLNIQFLQNAVNGDFDKFKLMFDKMSAVIIDQIDELTRISTEFSDFAKLPSEIASKFDLNKKLTEVCQLFATGQDSYEIVFNGRETPTYIEADAGQISRVFSNIIKNATQAVTGFIDAKVEVELFTNKEFAIVSVKDNGEGIPKEIYDKLFTPNFTTKSSGMGIGLSIAYNIVKTFNGDISFTSELGKGSTFIVTLPLCEM